MSEKRKEYREQKYGLEIISKDGNVRGFVDLILYDCYKLKEGVNNLLKHIEKLLTYIEGKKG